MKKFILLFGILLGGIVFANENVKENIKAGVDQVEDQPEGDCTFHIRVIVKDSCGNTVSNYYGGTITMDCDTNGFGGNEEGGNVIVRVVSLGKEVPCANFD